MYHPKVSITIPVYNTEKYLQQCLNSAINQTLQEIKIIEEFQKNDKHIQLINFKENKGNGVGRNTALKKAVIFLTAFFVLISFPIALVKK